MDDDDDDEEKSAEVRLLRELSFLTHFLILWQLHQVLDFFFYVSF